MAAGSLPTRGAWIEITDLLEQRRFFKSRSPHGERGLKSLHGFIPRHDGCCRSPHGERGLKSSNLRFKQASALVSLPTRGAWIEIAGCNCCFGGCSGRSPHGERGLKYADARYWTCTPGRSPHGERGLKSYNAIRDEKVIRSLPTRGAWIEIRITMSMYPRLIVAPHTGSVD